MATVSADGSSQSFGGLKSPNRVVWSESWRPPGAQSAFIKWNGWTLAMTMSWWQHHKHCRGYYYYYYYFQQCSLTWWHDVHWIPSTKYGHTASHKVVVYGRNDTDDIRQDTMHLAAYCWQPRQQNHHTTPDCTPANIQLHLHTEP